MQKVTIVPKVPNFVRGIINLRGKVIPVVELRAKFAMDKIEDTDKTAIIVFAIDSGTTKVTTGIIIDDVKEVTDLPAATIEPAPHFSESVDNDFIMGISKSTDSVRILLDIDKVLTDGEVSALANTAQ